MNTKIQHTGNLYPFASAALLTLFALTLSGCASPKPLQGGKAFTTKNQNGELTQTLTQGQNPAAPSKQEQHSILTRTYTLPPASRIEELRSQKTPTGLAITNLQTTVLSAPTPVQERQETYATTQLGAAQKDTAREFAAKLSSLKSIVWLGVAMFVFGIASFAWPPLRTIIGSVTTSAAITIGGLALIILPTLIVGNETLILAAVALAVGGWFLAHRHGHLRGALQTVAAAPAGYVAAFSGNGPSRPGPISKPKSKQPDNLTT